ncbi:MAG: exo-alpha-sialidase [Candidatus Eremiobacteraeota bacterium]|nr:exo-alpha-sialidase [Candidatus Eremiobacteraeota bacterium]
MSVPMPRVTYCIALCVVALFAAVLAACGGGATLPGVQGPPQKSTMPPPSLANVTLVSADPFTNTTSQHATELEPSMASFGSMIVATFQSGRFFTAGSSDIGFATSLNGGATWLSGFLPGTTSYTTPAGIFDSVSDPVVAYDAAHGVWLISSLPVVFSSALTPAALVSRSSDGIHWSAPVAVAAGQISSDKEWIACDDTSSSPYYGHCYLQWDDPSANGTIHVSRSHDGGLTWSTPANTGGNANGIAGQPLVQPNGTVIIPIDDYFEANVIAFASHDGGASWTTPITVAPIINHFEGGDLRSGPLPSGAMDASGRVYLVWQDCRFRAGCASNDLVMSSTLDGTIWNAPVRIPLDPRTSAVDHFIPGLSVAPGTSGATAQLGLSFYTYANTSCTSTSCLLSVGYSTSHDGGASWSAPVTIVGPMSPSWLADTDQGLMVGDYMASTIVGRQPLAVFAVAQPAPGAALNEAMYVSKLGVLPARALSLSYRRTLSELPVPGVRSDRRGRLRPP